MIAKHVWLALAGDENPIPTFSICVPMKNFHFLRRSLFASLALSTSALALADNRPIETLNATARQLFLTHHSSVPAQQSATPGMPNAVPMLQGFFANPREISEVPTSNGILRMPTDGTTLPFALYTCPNGTPGFVILSVNDHLPAIVAYSLHDRFDAAMVPDAMVKIFETYNEFLKSGQSLRTRTMAAESEGEYTETVIVEPMLDDILYDQGTPYNMLCPEYNGRTCATGCVATGMAEVMAYYRHPEQMRGNYISYATNDLQIPVEWDCENTVFDWANIRKSYGTYYEEDETVDGAHTDARFVFSEIAPSTEYPKYLEVYDFRNVSSESPRFSARLLLADDKGEFICPAGEAFNVNSFGPGYIYKKLYLMPSVPGNLPDGPYRLYVGTQDSGETAWGVVESIEDAQDPYGTHKEYYLEVTKEGEAFSLLGKRFPCGYNYTEAQAVATLMAAAGAAVEMDYTPSASGASSADAARALVRNFGYDPSIMYVNDSFYDPESWNAAIQHDLSAGHPILCGGQSVERYGHFFVMDGYMLAENGEEEAATPYYHLNWGWSGSCNGYFLLDHFQPSSAGTGGSTVNYSYVLRLTMGIRPDDGQPDGVVFGATSVESSVSEVETKDYVYINAVRVTNCSTMDFTGDVRVYAIQDDNEYFVGNLATGLKLPSAYYYDVLSKNIKVPSSIPSGDYTLELRVEGSDGTSTTLLCPAFPTVHIVNPDATSISRTEVSDGSDPDVRHDLHGRRTENASGRITVGRRGVEIR